MNKFTGRSNKSNIATCRRRCRHEADHTSLPALSAREPAARWDQNRGQRSTAETDLYQHPGVNIITSIHRCLNIMLTVGSVMEWSTRSFRLAVKPKTVPGRHLLIGNALVVDLPSLGSVRSAGTREYQWPTLCSWQKIARFGDRSQRRDATAERFASWWWWYDG